MATEPETALAEVAVSFSRALRAAGLDVPVGSVAVYAEALAAVGLDVVDHVYWAGRATLVRRPEDVTVYDAVFAGCWSAVPPAEAPPALTPVVVEEEAGLRWSAAEVLRGKDFAAYSAEEFDEARALMARLRLAASLRRSRRLRPVRRGSSGARPDLRRTARAALRTAGEPVRRAWTAPSRTPRRVVLLCDVSGSMEPYARALVRFLHVAVVGRARVEAFTMGTRLTRLTRELSARDPDAALRAAAEAAPDWSGGTRLGEALRAFNDRWGVRGMARGAVVVVLSDGWDLGSPDLLAEQMARLARIAHRVVWVNPLKASPGYEPLARGMAAALPHVDDFVDGHSLESLERLVEVIAS